MGDQVGDEVGHEVPLLRVVRGTPTAEELAALVGVLVSRMRAGVSGPSTGPAPSRWRASGLPRGSGRAALRAAPGGWHASGLPT